MTINDVVASTVHETYSTTCTRKATRAEERTTASRADPRRRRVQGIDTTDGPHLSIAALPMAAPMAAVTVLAACMLAKARAWADSTVTVVVRVFSPATNGAVGTPDMKASRPVIQMLDSPNPTSPTVMANATPINGTEGEPRRDTTHAPGAARD